MSPTPRPSQPLTPQQREATCLETDEDVLSALREQFAPPLGTPPPTAPSPGTPPPVTPPPALGTQRATPPPAPVRPATGSLSAAAFRPTLRPPMAVLTVFDDGKADGENFRLREGRFVIGRTEGDLLIPHDGMVSSRHVEITRQAVAGQQRWIITDLQSTNGLFVRVSRTVLADRAELLVGKGRYRLLAPTSEGGATADYTPPEGARNTTQAWGNDGATPAIPALVELVGNAISNRVLLLGPEYWIGTDPSCAICRVNDPFCEARHARLWRDAKGQWQVEQSKTVNGVWFRVPQVVCESTVQFQIGEQRLRLKVGG